MPVKEYRPTTPGRRQYTTLDRSGLDRKRPEKALTRPRNRTGGRNRSGAITVRHRGGGHKRRYRVVDFRRGKDGVPAKVAAIEYDPNRSANVALLYYADGEKRYIIAPEGLKKGDQILSGERPPIRVGNCLPLANIPVGTTVHCLELSPGKGAQLARSAGSWAQLLAKEGKFGHVRLPSGEVRLVFLQCRAVIGRVGNVDHLNIKKGKAGRRRWLGRRPHVRGAAMNPKDHPHGGGEGKAPIGHKSPLSPWGKPTLGKRTRTKRPSDKYIVRRRKG